MVEADRQRRPFVPESFFPITNHATDDSMVVRLKRCCGIDIASDQSVKVTSFVTEASTCLFCHSTELDEEIAACTLSSAPVNTTRQRHTDISVVHELVGQRRILE